jgi:hypothetical protein
VAASRTTHPRAAAPTGQEGWAGAALIALAATLLALSVLGPVVAGVIDYRISEEFIMSQLLALDAVGLVLVAPLAALAGALALRGHPAWPLVAVGPAIYVAYMVPQYVLGPDYLAHSGNNEAFFPLFLGAFVLALIVAVRAWTTIDPGAVRTSARAERLVARVLLPVAAFVVFIRYLPLLADVMSPQPTSEEYLAGPAFGWTITLLDLGIALPATVAAIVGFAKGAAWARKALYAVVSWFALVGVAVGAMAVAMYIRDDPGVVLGTAVFMTVLGAALVLMAALLYAPLLRHRD